MAPLYEIPPTHCPICGADWRRPRTFLVGWANQREVPCRSYVCRTCEMVIYRPSS